MKFSWPGLAAALTGIGALVAQTGGQVQHLTPPLIVAFLSIVLGAFQTPVVQTQAAADKQAAK